MREKKSKLVKFSKKFSNLMREFFFFFFWGGGGGGEGWEGGVQDLLFSHICIYIFKLIIYSY